MDNWHSCAKCGVRAPELKESVEAIVNYSKTLANKFYKSENYVLDDIQTLIKLKMQQFKNWDFGKAALDLKYSSPEHSAYLTLKLPDNQETALNKYSDAFVGQFLSIGRKDIHEILKPIIKYEPKIPLDQQLQAVRNKFGEEGVAILKNKAEIFEYEMLIAEKIKLCKIYTKKTRQK